MIVGNLSSDRFELFARVYMQAHFLTEQSRNRGLLSGPIITVPPPAVDVTALKDSPGLDIAPYTMQNKPVSSIQLKMQFGNIAPSEAQGVYVALWALLV